MGRPLGGGGSREGRGESRLGDRGKGGEVKGCRDRRKRRGDEEIKGREGEMEEC